MMTVDERNEFVRRLRAHGWGGAFGRMRLGMYEVFALPDGQHFPIDVQMWLMGRGFVRRDDPIDGPFWERPGEMEVIHE